VFTTPLIAALRRTHASAHLSYVVEPAAAPVLQGNPHLDELIVAPRRRRLGRLADDLRLARRLRRARFDAAIDLHGGPRSALLTWATGAPTRVGYAIPGRAWMYTHAVPRTPEPSIRHSVLNQWDLLAPLGIDRPPDPEDLPVEMREDPAAGPRVTALLTRAGLPPARQIIVVHVSASNPFKRWPAASFVDAVVRLLDNHTERVACVVSGPSEPGAAAEVVRRARAALGTGAHRVVAPQLGLPDLHALIARAAVYIGGDSGPLHVAATTRTPIVELLGPTLASRSFPWRPSTSFAAILDAGSLPCRPCAERTCVPGDFRCLTRISPAQVVDAAERALASGGTG
jgi:ADP-heptose:LPS heptosyltransferase